MAEIYNSDVTKGLQETCKIQINRDKVPNQLAEKIVPVVSADPKKICNVVVNNAKTVTGAQTLYTTPTTGDFYINSIQITVDCDVVCDSVLYYVNTVIAGATVRLIDFRKTTTTITNKVITISYPMPIKIDRGSAIQITQSFTAGASTISGCLTGYLVED